MLAFAESDVPVVAREPRALVLPVCPPPRAGLQAERVLRFGHCEVRPACREVLVERQHRELQPRPFDLLVYLIEHRDRVLPIDELLDAVWGERLVQISSLASAVARIRAVLGDGYPGEIIRTHHRVGYRFVAPLQGEAAS